MGEGSAEPSAGYSRRFCAAPFFASHTAASSSGGVGRAATSSLDDLIGAQQERRRDSEAESAGGLEIDNEVEFVQSLDGQ